MENTTNVPVQDLDQLQCSLQYDNLFVYIMLAYCALVMLGNICLSFWLPKLTQENKDIPKSDSVNSN